MEGSSAVKCKLTVVLLAMLIGLISAQNVRFTQDNYSASANETTSNIPRPPAGFVIVTCFHTLDNSTSNITYQLVTNEPIFSMNETSGELMALMDLDYETTISYELIVQCQSELNTSWVDEATINVTVLPINEFRPTVSTSTESEIVLEGTPLGTVIVSTLPGGRVRYFVDDEDDGPDGNIFFTAVITSDTENSFAFNTSVGALYLVQDFDFDADRTGPFRTIDVVITVCDSSPPAPDCLNIDVTLILFASNDNKPSFVDSLLNVSFSETANLSTVITQVECLDADFGAGALRGYQVVAVSPLDTPAGTFLVNSTGAVTLGSPLDYEFTTNYVLQVNCSDSGSGIVNMDSATIRVNVSAANDNRPTFLNSSLNISLTFPESVDVSTVITEVECFDIDIVVGGFEGYEIVSISPASTPAGTFTINETGIIMVDMELDFEFTERYELEVRCFDSGSLDDFTTVRVNVTDVNDNSPVCSHVSDQILSTGTHSHGSIVRLNCTDRDSGLNAELRYTFVNTPELASGEFQLNAITGEVAFLGTVNVNREYTLSIVVSDSGARPRSTTLFFQVATEGAVVSPAILLPLWAIVIVVVCLLLLCCLLTCFMCLCHCCFKRRKGMGRFSNEEIEDNDKDLVISQYPPDGTSPESDNVELNKSYKDYVLHFKTTAFDDTSTCPTTPASVSSDEEEEGVVYTSSTEVILNPSTNTAEYHLRDIDSPLDAENAPLDIESSPPDVKSL